MRIQENPFIVSGKIKPEYFCDRVVEVGRLKKLLIAGNNVLIRSDRRMGKTGLLIHTFDEPEIKEQYTTFFVDILHTTCLQEFVHEVGRTIYEQCIKHNKSLSKRFIDTLRSISGKMSFDPASGMPSFSLSLGDIVNPEYTLRELFQFLQANNKPCILAIDEFQQIAKYPEHNIEALLRGHIQQIDNCRFVYAGSERHLLGMMFEKSSRPFYKSTSNIDLDAIDRDTYVDFIVKMFGNNDRYIDINTAAQVYDLFDGHTYYVQKMMNEAFSNTEKGESCDKQTVLFSLLSIINDNNTLYREELSKLTLRQKELLYAIASERNAIKITSSSFIKKHSLNSASSVQVAVKKLIDDDLVVESNNIYRVSDRFFAYWLQQMNGKSLESLIV